MSEAMPRPFRIALLASLLLNAALAGALAAHWLRDGAAPAVDEPAERVRAPSPDRLGRELAPGQRALMREVFERHRGGMRERIEATRVSRRDVADALRAEPFDRAALAAAFAGLRDHETEAAAASHAMLLDLADRLDASGRERLAARIERAGHHRAMHRRMPKPPTE